MVTNSVTYQPTEMTPADVVRIRQGLGWSQAELARQSRMGAGAARTVRAWELGQGTRIPGPVQVAMEALEVGWRPGMQSADEMIAPLRTERNHMPNLGKVQECLEHLENLARATLSQAEFASGLLQAE